MSEAASSAESNGEPCVTEFYILSLEARLRSAGLPSVATRLSARKTRIELKCYGGHPSLREGLSLEARLRSAGLPTVAQPMMEL